MPACLRLPLALLLTLALATVLAEGQVTRG